jgi:hypothetical protein
MFNKENKVVKFLYALVRSIDNTIVSISDDYQKLLDEQKDLNDGGNPAFIVRVK